MNTTAYFFGVLIAVCLLFVVDCTCASVDWRSGSVTDKVIHPGWVEYHHDKDRSWSTYHPAEYFVCAEVNGRVGRISVTQWNYDQWRVGQSCEVQFRKGKLMTYGYFALRRGDW